MKKITYYLIGILCVLLFACTDQVVQENELTLEQNKVSKNAGPVFVVEPNGVDDTDNLVQAFEDAKAAGPGSTVQLVEGEYNVGFVLVKEFVGSFKGVGMGKTIIKPLIGLPCSEFLAQELTPNLIKFLRGNVSISNMSFRNPEGEPCPGDDLWSYLGIHDWVYDELPSPPVDHMIKVVIDHVEFSSHLDPVRVGWSPFTVQAAIVSGGDFVLAENVPYSTIDISVTNCTFTEIQIGLLCGVNGDEKGRTVFSNNGPVGARIGVWVTDNIGGTTLISENEFFTPEWGQCIAIQNALWNVFEFKLSDGALYEISGNKFHTMDAWGAITLGNDRKAYGIIDNGNALLVLIKNNLFDLQGSTMVGIWNWITDDAVIKNNKFTGTAAFGIYVNPRTTNSLMLGNNFSNLVCASDIEWLPGFGENYNILLLGNDNSIIGGSNSNTTVLNLGENNTITGAKFDNEGEKPVGQTITDNYTIWRESLKNMRKP